jgi:23S rRNA pseudouridine1911/1915/1917 synthase
MSVFSYKRKGEYVELKDRTRLHLFPVEQIDFVANYMEPLDILFEDDFCLVVHKRAGLKVHPIQDKTSETDTLANLVAAHYESSGQAIAVRHIHRLDADTTGLVLYAKCPFALQKLDEAMRDKKIGRTYVALVHGILKKKKGTIDAPIGKDRHHKSRRRVSATGQSAITHYEVIETYPGEESYSLVRLTLETGRTHQIRVHMSHLGYPLLGDTLYGGKSFDGKVLRQMLHGETLSFTHPFTNEQLTIVDPLPEDFQYWMHGPISPTYT